MGFADPVHAECRFRSRMGSAGHILGLCSCNGGPDIMDDPPDMSAREASRYAMLVFRAKSEGNIKLIAELLRIHTKRAPRTLH